MEGSVETLAEDFCLKVRSFVRSFVVVVVVVVVWPSSLSSLSLLLSVRSFVPSLVAECLPVAVWGDVVALETVGV